MEDKSGLLRVPTPQIEVWPKPSLIPSCLAHCPWPKVSFLKLTTFPLKPPLETPALGAHTGRRFAPFTAARLYEATAGLQDAARPSRSSRLGVELLSGSPLLLRRCFRV